MGRDSFIFYDAYYEHLQLLTNEQAGVLLKAIYAYRLGKPFPEMDGAVKIAFSFIRIRLDFDQEKYDKKCAINKANGQFGAEHGKKGGRPKKNTTNDKNLKTPKNPERGFENPEKPRKTPDNDNDNDTDNDLEKRNNKLFPKKEDGETVSPALSEEMDLTAAQAGKATKKKFVPPTREDVRAYAIQRGREDLAQPFFDFFDTGKWHDSNGKPVRNWKQKFITWETHNPKKETQPQETTEPRKTAFFWEGD